MFPVLPGRHRADIPYTFWDANSTTNDPVANITAALNIEIYHCFYGDWLSECVSKGDEAADFLEV
jgi:hypothetical protein